MTDTLKSLTADAVAESLITGHLNTGGSKLPPDISNFVFRRAYSKMALSGMISDTAVEEITEKLDVTEVKLAPTNVEENFYKMVCNQNITNLHILNIDYMCVGVVRRAQPLAIANHVDEPDSEEEEEEDENVENETDGVEDEEEDESTDEEESEDEEQHDDEMEPADSDIDNDDLVYIQQTPAEDNGVRSQCRIVEQLQRLLNPDSREMLTELGIAGKANNDFIEDDWLEKTLQMLPKLDSFLLQDHRWPINGFATLCAHTNITKLHLSNARLQSLAGISSLSNLIVLEILDAVFSDASDVVDIFDLKKLQVLNIGVREKFEPFSNNLMYYMQCGKVLPHLRALNCFNNRIDMAMLQELAETHKNLKMVNLIATKLDEKKMNTLQMNDSREPIVLLTREDLFQCCSLLRQNALSDYACEDIFEAACNEIERLIPLADPSMIEVEFERCFPALLYVLRRFCNLDNAYNEKICWFHCHIFKIFRLMLEKNAEWIDQVNVKDLQVFIESTFTFFENFILSEKIKSITHWAYLHGMYVIYYLRRHIDTYRMARLGAKLMMKIKYAGPLYNSALTILFLHFEPLTQEQQLFLTDEYPILHQMSSFFRHADIMDIQSIGDYPEILNLIMKLTWRDSPTRKAVIAHTKCLTGIMKYEFSRLSEPAFFWGFIDVIAYAAKKSLKVFFKKDSFACYSLLKELTAKCDQRRYYAAKTVMVLMYYRKRKTSELMSEDQLSECRKAAKTIAHIHLYKYEEVKELRGVNFIRWTLRHYKLGKVKKLLREYLAEYSRVNKNTRRS